MLTGPRSHNLEVGLSFVFNNHRAFISFLSELMAALDVKDSHYRENVIMLRDSVSIHSDCKVNVRKAEYLVTGKAGYLAVLRQRR
jgi:hypothetical protein